MQISENTSLVLEDFVCSFLCGNLDSEHADNVGVRHDSLALVDHVLILVCRSDFVEDVARYSFVILKEDLYSRRSNNENHKTACTTNMRVEKPRMSNENQPLSPRGTGKLKREKMV
jgi:hypothetical protein